MPRLALLIRLSWWRPEWPVRRYHASTPPGKLSVLVGRSPDGLCPGGGATPMPDVWSLTDLAKALQLRGMVAVTNVVLSRTPRTGPDACVKGRLYPSYTTLAMLHNTYG